MELSGKQHLYVTRKTPADIAKVTPAKSLQHDSILQASILPQALWTVR